MDTVGKWAERRQIGYTTYADLSQKREVYALIFQEVERANRDLPEATRIRRFALLPKELDPDDEEVTRTRKLRRRVIAEKYARFIEALYGDREEIEVATTVVYEDGRRATIESRVRIGSVGPGVAAHV
jgi:long-chain acyl-CoA synthetase